MRRHNRTQGPYQEGKKKRERKRRREARHWLKKQIKMNNVAWLKFAVSLSRLQHDYNRRIHLRRSVRYTAQEKKISLFNLRWDHSTDTRFDEIFSQLYWWTISIYFTLILLLSGHMLFILTMAKLTEPMIHNYGRPPIYVPQLSTSGWVCRFWWGLEGLLLNADSLFDSSSESDTEIHSRDVLWPHSGFQNPEPSLLMAQAGEEDWTAWAIPALLAIRQ